MHESPLYGGTFLRKKKPNSTRELNKRPLLPPGPHKRHVDKTGLPHPSSLNLMSRNYFSQLQNFSIGLKEEQKKTCNFFRQSGAPAASIHLQCIKVSNHPFYFLCFIFSSSRKRKKRKIKSKLSFYLCLYSFLFPKSFKYGSEQIKFLTAPKLADPLNPLYICTCPKSLSPSPPI